jgi:hypothetical protein
MVSPSARRRMLALVPVAALGLLSAHASHGSGPETLLGTWTGTSRCVNKKQYPSCNDETVIYRFAASPSGTSSTLLTADKLVDGKPQTMGVMEFTFDPALHAWVSEFRTSRFHAVWTLALGRDDKVLTGTLVELPSPTLIREISVTRRGNR